MTQQQEKHTPKTTTHAHTPSPWYVYDNYCKDDKEQLLGISKTGYSDIAKVHTPHDISDRHMDEARANARLIAAAPDLLDMLDRMQFAFFCTQFIMTDEESRKTVSEMVAEAKSIISRALGNSENATTSTEA
jgi:hypothetical protein